MLMKVQMRVWCLCCLALWASGQTHANSKMTIDDFSENWYNYTGEYGEGVQIPEKQGVPENNFFLRSVYER